MADKEIKGNYKETETYRKVDGKTRAALERYKKENKIENNHMYLLLLREDVRNLPKEEKQRGNRLAEIIVISGAITFLVLTANQRMDLLPYSAAYMLIAGALYFSGILNPVARQLSNVNKLLKKFPGVPSIKEVLGEKKEES
ncbi:MAG: hypothetical protein K5908_09130 [Erysipelotrichaceae bacterium]|nr:hypothetical protein [Erysipelotrichaceae bacterium]